MKGFMVIGQTLDGKPLYKREGTKDVLPVFVSVREIPVIAKLFGVVCNETVAKKCAYRELTK